MDTREQVIEKLTKLRDAQFGGDTRKMFDHYAHDGKLSKAELTLILIDANIGNRMTRGLYVKAIFEIVDANDDQSLSAGELDRVIKGD